MNALKETQKGIIVKVKVIPRSGEFEIESYDDYLDAFKVRLKSPAMENKANLELIKKLEEKLGCEVKIIKGFKSKTKELILSCDKEKAFRFFKN